MSLGSLSLTQFQEHVTRRHQVGPYAPLENHFSADEVEGMSPQQHSMMLDHAAKLQRGAPEARMLDLQRLLRGGVLNHAVEHVGDLTHRINEGGGRYGLEFVAPKVRTTYGSLSSRYGFGREHEENVRESGVDPEALRTAGQEYSRAHAALPVYNQPSESARWAAWNLGHLDFSGARTHMHNLSRMIEDPEHYKSLISQQGTVEHLRRQERSRAS